MDDFKVPEGQLVLVDTNQSDMDKEYYVAYDAANVNNEGGTSMCAAFVKYKGEMISYDRYKEITKNG